MTNASFDSRAARFAAALPARAFDGVRTRRIFAAVLDLALIGGLSFAIAVFFALPTLGLSLFFLPALFPAIAFFYNGLTGSSVHMGTWGMRIMDLEMGLPDGSRAPFLNAAAHALLFYLSWSFPLVFLVSLLSDDKRCLHDMLADIIVTRRTL